MGTREAIAVARLIGKTCIDHEQDVCVKLCFGDYKKALNRGMKSIGIDWQDRRLIERLDMGQSTRVRLKEGLSDPAVIGRGTRQGCLLSPILFNVYVTGQI